MAENGQKWPTIRIFFHGTSSTMRMLKDMLFKVRITAFIAEL
jgi:hypothetical protein